MTRAARGLMRLARAEGGAAALEFSIIAFVFILVCLGTVEFGRALQVRNEMASAAGIGARLIMIGQDGQDATDAEVTTAIRDRFRGGGDADLEVELGTTIVDGETFRTIEVRYPVTLQVPVVSGRQITLTVSRRVRPRPAT